MELEIKPLRSAGDVIQWLVPLADRLARDFGLFDEIAEATISIDGGPEEPFRFKNENFNSDYLKLGELLYLAAVLENRASKMAAAS